MKAFVAGATGYTGREVVRALRDAGHETFAHVRPDSPSLAVWRSRFEALDAKVDTTAWEPEAMTATMKRVAPDLVFALLGTTKARGKAARARGAREESYESVDYALTAMLLRAAQAVAPPPRLVYLSAIGARADAGNPYLAVRGRLEAELRGSGVPFTIARPSWITGSDRDGRTGERIGASVTDALVGVAGLLGARRLRSRYASMTGSELAEGLVRIATDPAFEGRVVESDLLR